MVKEIWTWLRSIGWWCQDDERSCTWDKSAEIHNLSRFINSTSPVTVKRSLRTSCTFGKKRETFLWTLVLPWAISWFFKWNNFYQKKKRKVGLQESRVNTFKPKSIRWSFVLKADCCFQMELNLWPSLLLL